METKQKAKWIVAAFWAADVVLMLADGALTWINTPDLSNEGNPLVSVLGLGWGALFTANLLVFLLYLWLTWYAFVKYEPPLLHVKNMREYTSQLYFNRPDKYIWVLYRFPKNWKPVWQIVGYALAVGMPAARLILVFEWGVITAGFSMKKLFPWYYAMKNAIPFGRVDVYVALLAACLTCIIASRKRFRNNQKRLALEVQ